MKHRATTITFHIPIITPNLDSSSKRQKSEAGHHHHQHVLDPDEGRLHLESDDDRRMASQGSRRPSDDFEGLHVGRGM